MGNRAGASRAVSVLVLGLDQSGKTSYLNALADESSLVLGSAVPTAGYNVCSLVFAGRAVRFIDVGGSEAERENWKYLFREADAVIYVVDSTDRTRLEESGVVLSILFHQSELAACPFLVLANKQDLFMAMTSQEIADAFNLSGNLGRPVHVEACSSVSGENIRTSLDWLVGLCPA